MKKRFTFLIAAIAAILMMTLPAKVVGQEVTYDFTNTNNFYTDSNLTTHPSTGNTNTLNAFYYTGGSEFNAGGKGYFNSGYFMLGKKNATLQLPTFSFNVKKIVVVGRSGASGSTGQNIYVGSTAVSTATTGSTGTNTYLINSSYQASGTTYSLKVTSDHNAQITSIQIYRAYTVTYNANGGGGTMTDNNTYANGDEVTLLSNSFTAPSGYTFNGWSVKDASNNTITVTNNKFTMPASNVTVTAQWLATGPTVTIDPTSHDFGEVTVGTTPSPTHTFSVTPANLTADLTITVPSGYSVSPSSISQSTTTATNVIVTFTPTAVQAYNGNLSISGGGLDSNVTASLSGTGGCITPSALTYTSPVNLPLENGEVEYVLAPTGGGNGGSISYAVTTNPDGNGDIIGDDEDTFYAVETGQYVVTATQAANGNYCECVATITINVTSTDPSCEISPEIWDFGKVLTGTYVEKTFTVNTANLEDNLTVGIDHTADGFSVTPTTINQAATSTEVTVRFAPTAATADLTATLTISGGGLASNVVALISGQGDAGYTVTFNPYSGTCTPTSIRVATGGSIAELPTATADGATFYGWATSKVASTTSAPSIVSAPYTPTGNVNLHATYKIAKEFDNTAACAGSYTIYSVVETSDKATTNYYATGTLNKKYSSTTTASDAKSFTLTKVSGYGNDEWAIKDGDNYVAYNSGTDLTTQSGDYKWIITQGVKGTWRITAASTLNSTIRGFVFQAGTTNKFGGYAISNLTPGAAYYDIEFGGASFTYNSETPVAKPTYNLAGGSYAGAQSVTISCTTPDATIYYTTNGSDPTASSTEYTGAITVDETMTIKAVAIKSGMANSTVAYATYSIVPLLTTMDQIFAAATANGGTAGNVAVSFNDWVVSGIAGTDNQIVYVTDNDGKGFIIYKYNNGFALNDKLSGTVAGTPLLLSYGSAEFTGLTASAEGIIVTHDGEITPVTKTISQLTSGVNTGAVVTISNLTYNGTNLVDGSENTITPNTSLFSYGSALTSGHDYSSITGVFVMNNTTKQIHPRSAADIVEVEYNITLNDVPSGCTIGTDGDITTAKYGQTVTLTQSAGDGYRFISWSVNSGAVTVTNNQFTMPKGNVTVSATFAPTYAITVSATPANTGTVTAEPNPAIEGETVTLTIEPEDGYALKSITAFKTGESSTPVTITDNTITMPAYGVTVAAEFATEYSVTYNVNGGTGDAVVVKYGAGATVNAADVPGAWTAPEGKLFKNWKTVASGEGTEYEVGAEITDNIAANYVLYAQWRDIVYHVSFSVNGVIVSERNVNYNTAIGTLPEDPELAPLTFLGWSSTLATGATDVTASWKPTGENEDVTVYAVFGSMSEINMAITTSSSGITNAYKDNTGFTIGSIDFTCNDICKQGSGTEYIQMKSSGYIYNDTDNSFGKITSIVVTYNTTPRSVIVKVGTSANPTSSSALTGVKDSEDDNIYTYTPASGTDYGYILIGASETIKMNSIVINYEASAPVAITNVTGKETIASITAGNCVVVHNNGILTFTGSNNDASKLIVQDGGQLKVTGGAKDGGVKATVYKHINGVDNWSGENADWNFIASPITESFNPASTVMTSNTYDLYQLNNTRWENYKEHEGNAHPLFSLANERGYLYANSADVELEFAGTVRPYDADHTIDVAEGWNLVGNPYTFDAYATVPYYAMNAEGTGITANTVATSTAVKPCTGIIIKAAGDGNVKFLDEAPVGSANNSNLQITLAHNVTSRDGASTSSTLDNAIVSFNEGTELEKFYFGTQNANIYIPQDNEEYAIVSSEARGEMPVNFKAAKDGEYSLTVNVENVEMNYLHLIDNIAGQDFDLIATPIYTFNAKADDYESRFRLVFSANNENQTENENFAFISNGELIVNGTGTIQIIDMMGRVVSTRSTEERISTNGMTAGVYVLQLINGSETKTQKIVVR